MSMHGKKERGRSIYKEKFQLLERAERDGGTSFTVVFLYYQPINYFFHSKIYFNMMLKYLI